MAMSVNSYLRDEAFLKHRYFTENRSLESIGKEVGASKYAVSRFELSNGRTLCVKCHKKTETHSRRML